jgi:hypothetical protein
MKLGVKNVVHEITIAEVIKQVFEILYIEEIPKIFYCKKEVAMREIDRAIEEVLGYDDGVNLDNLYEKSDLDVVRNKVYDIMHSIAKTDEESE